MSSGSVNLQVLKYTEITVVNLSEFTDFYFVVSLYCILCTVSALYTLFCLNRLMLRCLFCSG